MKEVIEYIIKWIKMVIEKIKPKPEPEPEPGPGPTPPEPPQPEPGTDIPKGTVFLHKNISKWPVTTKLSPSLSGNTIKMDFDKTKVWPVVDNVNANAWIIFDYNGKTYAATWEWFKKGGTTKKLNDDLGTYIKKDPPIPRNYHPQVGQRVGLMVSGLCRSNTTNVSERSAVVWVEWKYKR